MKKKKSKRLTALEEIIRSLSDRIVKAQQPIRILDALKWDQSIQADFFKNKCEELPAVDKDFYLSRPLPYNPDEKKAEFYEIERDIRRQLGQFSGVGNIMSRMCHEYREVVRMLEARGTPEFSKISQDLYGSSQDAFYVNAPTLRDLATLLSETLVNIKSQVNTEADVKRYSSEQAVEILGKHLAHYFSESAKDVRVQLSDEIVADAAAGAERIKIRSGAQFSERDLKALEVHEGWVHLGTTLNGMAQPVCTFLSKGPPSSTVSQEGLAIIMEIFTFSSHPARVQRLTDRITAISMAERGADFLDVFRFYRERGMSDEDCYASTVRVFRGSTPKEPPFTKDLVYSKGFILIYNYIRLAIQSGLVSRIPLLFLGKTTLEDLHVLEGLLEEGLVVPPQHIPPQFHDLAALSAWMCYSLFLNRLNLQSFREDYKSFLQQ